MMISKEREPVGRTLSLRLYSVGQEQVDEYVPQREDLLEMIARLTNMFLLNHKGSNSPSEIINHDHYCLGKIVARAESKRRATFIQGHQLLLSLVLLLIYLHRRLIECPNRANLKDLIEFHQYGERIMNPDVDELGPVLAALLNGREGALGEMSDSSRHLVARYRDIQDCFPREIDDDALSCFADWLVYNVTLDQIVAHSEEGSRILQNALAFENMACTSPNNHLSM